MRQYAKYHNLKKLQTTMEKNCINNGENPSRFFIQHLLLQRIAATFWNFQVPLFPPFLEPDLPSKKRFNFFF